MAPVLSCSDPASSFPHAKTFKHEMPVTHRAPVGSQSIYQNTRQAVCTNGQTTQAINTNLLSKPNGELAQKQPEATCKQLVNPVGLINLLGKLDLHGVPRQQCGILGAGLVVSGQH